MGSPPTFEESLEQRLAELDILEMATNFLSNKHALRESLQEATESLYALSKNVHRMSRQLEDMKEQNIEMKELYSLFKRLNEKIAFMTENIPWELVEQSVNITNLDNAYSSTPVTLASANTPAPSATKGHLTNITNLDNTATENVKDCRKALFRMDEDVYTIEPLTQEEFTKIPKYMIGRQSLVNVNAFIATINQIMKAKYSLLALGKIGAKKKGEFDLFMQFKKEEADLKGTGREKVYFFTGEDYYRETKTKLDKTKLNLMTVLRHCKRLQEIRDGKHYRYQIIT